MKPTLQRQAHEYGVVNWLLAGLLLAAHSLHFVLLVSAHKPCSSWPTPHDEQVLQTESLVGVHDNKYSSVEQLGVEHCLHPTYTARLRVRHTVIGFICTIRAGITGGTRSACRATASL